ncbi:TRAP transporter small permease subunit [Pusillimonas sp. DMV24BSW_D]|uniref:TRAP transporter small permease n=1 Tax=Neopusillimonas aestuarii TaxID=2716226 RepID=UPI00140D4723|nr:TRAP transporter small permease subunit [Pusillimonas sp. DMV24BSW_D]QIM48807.1 TRAP transporter small permease subunit [Pusillimonas sp. DMV24BSW_D]
MAFAKFLFKLASIVSVFLLVFMVVMTDADVFFRQLFNRSIFGAAELVNFALAIVIGAGLVTAVRDKCHISVDIFSDYLSCILPRFHRAWLAWINVLGIFSVASLVTFYAVKKIHDRELSFLLEFQVGWVFLACGILCFMAFLVQLITQVLRHPE